MNSQIPHLPGGVDLQAMPQPKTQHTTFFQSCRLNIAALSDEDGIVRGYQLQIIDPQENHTYIFGINRSQEKDKIAEAFNDLPDIGFPAEKPA